MKVAVLGASVKPERFSNKAVRLLKRYGHDVIPVGLRHGEIDGLKIIKFDEVENLSAGTVTLYLSAKNQKPYYDLIFSFNPSRVIFNPGTENDELKSILESKGIETVEDCTLQMLRRGEF
jgi:predicted CoA-binding protein